MRGTLTIIVSLLLSTTVLGQHADSNSKISPQSLKYYLVMFGCCFKTDSVIINYKNEIYFTGIVNTNEMTGSDDRLIIPIPSPNKQDTCELIFVKTGQRIRIPLENLNKNRFIEVIYYLGYLKYEINDRPLLG